ncbi:efflux RND transporter periplasmic adaptor subunit [Sulfitobacter sp. D35]|uniref:efflux RND transporter periplasmic adaptor subunit n=1 Tax=Sulfitobacter sp. D35 TaxID=3083252 RepID=UPI00296F1A22|nr:efflux RND transporter periplasmic adaptor subunit [Sulfitobacter sp. D35]MDW4499890.1 efflux RND transporter periplasmic adaptor subunit [Sulfitobacter sp. D35]
MKPFLLQSFLSLAVLAAALALWIAYVPAAMPLLDRLGVLDVLGIDADGDATGDGARGGWGGGGPVPVVVAEVTNRTVADRVTAIGDGRALRAVTVRSEAVGRITELSLSAGGRVEAGDVIVRLDDEAETIAVERAQVVLENARDDAARVARLENTGAVTEVRAREAQLALRTAELELRQATYDLEQRRIVAPIAGWVGIVDVDVGERIAAQEEIVTITDRSRILIDFRVPERVIGQMSVGMPVDVTPLGLRDLTLEGEVSAIDTVVDRASRTMRVQGRVTNDADRLRVGMAFSVALTFPGDERISVDPLAVQWSSEGAFVWVIRAEKAARVPVQILQRDSNAVLIEADLQPGEPVVIEGVQSLRPGSDVAIAERSEAREVGLPTSRL